MDMPIKDIREKVIGDWLSASEADLKSAKVLYENKLFSTSIYHLQQSNEKLAKSLLMSMGVLTPKSAKKDLKVKEWLGFLPKEPAAYRHRTMPNFLSDIEKTVPSIDALLTFIESSELGPRMQEYHLMVRKSRKGVQKLKKKPFSPVTDAEQLSKEVLAAKAILGALDNSIIKMKQEMAKLDLSEVYLITKGLVKTKGYDVEGVEPPDFDKIKESVVSTLRLSILTTMSIAIASLLDPLEAVTRYPDTQQVAFDQNHPYVLNFTGLSDVVACLLEKSQEYAESKKIVTDEKIA